VSEQPADPLDVTPLTLAVPSSQLLLLNPEASRRKQGEFRTGDVYWQIYMMELPKSTRWQEKNAQMETPVNRVFPGVR
jgi:hypothetical protein